MCTSFYVQVLTPKSRYNNPDYKKMSECCENINKIQCHNNLLILFDIYPSENNTETVYLMFYLICYAIHFSKYLLYATIVGNYCPLQKQILMELGLHLCMKDSQKVSEREHTSPCAT